MIKLTSASGFTIAELMIATSIFSLVLLVGAAAFIGLGKSYYKGYTLTQTQETAKQIINDVSSNIRLSSSVSGGSSSGGRAYYCVGSHRYTYILYREVNGSNHDNSSNFGLLQDEPNGDGCGDPFGSPGVAFVKPAELLANHMRLLAFSINPVGSNGAYSIQLTVASGSDDSLTDPNSATAQCKNQVSGNRFCAVTTLTSVVHQGVSV